MEPSTRLDRASTEEARQLLTACCGSSAWVERMVRRRPFNSAAQLATSARRAWADLSQTDWLEAFSHHPRIGDRESLARRFPDTAHLSEREQSGVTGAAADVLDQLADANRAYEARFGYIFIVCAAGRSATEMLETLRDRLGNDPAAEIQIAAEEQAKITELRLMGLG